MPKRYRIDVNPNLREPLKVLRFLEETTNKDIADVAITSYLECKFDEILGDAHGNPSKLTKDTLARVKESYKKVHKMMWE